MNRRTILAAAASVPIAACATLPARQAPSLSGQTFVLVHGAWHGGWCWREVREILEAQGARVFTPTLTGLGERAHLRDPVPSLATHIEDIVRVLEWEELSGVTLVGHSYGGMVVTGVADRAKAKIKHVVYLDAAFPKNGQTFASQYPRAAPAQVAATEAQFRALAPDGAWMGVLPVTVLGIPADNPKAAWVARRLTPHPLRTWLDPIALPNGGAGGLKRTYVLCTNPVMQNASFMAHAAILKADPGWTYREIATGHDAMVTAPEETARLLGEGAVS
jgi:pimeloyl-ACP methyl ester carboxylesterase